MRVGLEGAAIVRQDGGVNRIRLGPFTLGAGEVTNAPGFNTDGDAGGVQRPRDRLFITGGGLADDMRPGINREKFDQTGVAPGIIAQGI